MENKVFTVKSLNSLSTNNKIKDQVLQPQSIEFKKCYLLCNERTMPSD